MAIAQRIEAFESMPFLLRFLLMFRLGQTGVLLPELELGRQLHQIILFVRFGEYFENFVLELSAAGSFAILLLTIRIIARIC